MEISDIHDIPALQQWVKDHALRVGHLAGEGEASNENKGAGPYLWKWADVEGCMNKVTELVSLKDAIRRNIGLVNPTANGQPRLSLGLQVVLPGEQAPSHRHSATAIRFVVKGTNNAYNIGRGEPMPFEEGDLITNPHLTFHGHYNHGDGPVMWLDGLDGRFAGLAHLFRENYEGQEPLNLGRLGESNKLMSRVRPANVPQTHQPPPFRYPWAETESALKTLVASEEEPDPYDGYLVSFLNPVTAGPTCPTVGCEMQLLPAGFKGSPHRHNSQVVYHVFRGQGATVVDGERFEWAKGDFLDVPHWAEHYHENPTHEDCWLFSFSDEPAVRALGLWETQDTHAEKGLPVAQR